MEKIVIVGGGGHAASIIDTIKRIGVLEIAGYVDIKNNAGYLEYQYLGDDDILEKLFANGVKKAAIGIGFLGKTDKRNIIYEKLVKIGYELPIIIDPSAIVSDSTIIKEGSYIGKGAIINTGSKIGKLCIINSGTIVEHNSTIDDFSHVSVGAVICGDTTIGKNTFIGANATVIQKSVIGNNVIIGAGAVINKNVDDNHTCVGNPGIIIR